MISRLKLCSAACSALVLVALTPLGASAAFPGNNGRIIFDRELAFLVSMEPDGSDATRLTSGRVSAGASWAPDGSRFIYSRFVGDGTLDLFLRDADGSNPTRVTDSVRDEVKVAFGPDGNQAVYEKCGGIQCDLFIIDLTTSIETRVTRTRADEIAPDWSVDDLIVYERLGRRSDSEIFTIHPDGTTRTRLTDNRGPQDESASWSPDGTRIVYSRCGFEKNCDLFTMDPDGSGKDSITNTRTNEYDAQFSPNGRSFVVTRSRDDASSNLFRMRINGRHLRRLTDTPNKSEAGPSWQPVP